MKKLQNRVERLSIQQMRFTGISNQGPRNNDTEGGAVKEARAMETYKKQKKSLAFTFVFIQPHF